MNQQGIRFLLLLIPSLFFVLYDFIKQKKYLIYAVSFLFLVNVVNYKSYEYELGNQAFKEENIEMYKYLETNINESDYIAFHKPRLLRLMIDRKVVYLDQSTLNKRPSFVIVKIIDEDTFSKQYENIYIKLEEFEDYVLFKKANYDNLFQLQSFSTIKRDCYLTKIH